MEMDVRALNALIPVFDFVGIVAFALSGVFEGIKRRIDPVGVFIVAFSTAFGGGMLRDILIDRRPFYWIDHEAYVVATFVICMAAPFIYKFFQRTKHAHDWYIFADAFSVFQELRFRSQPECPGCLPSSSDASPVFSAV